MSSCTHLAHEEDPVNPHGPAIASEPLQGGPAIAPRERATFSVHFVCQGASDLDLLQCGRDFLCSGTLFPFIYDSPSLPTCI